MPDRNTQRLIGVVLALGVILVAQLGGISARLERVENDLRSLDARLRAVEVGFGKVDQRLATIERVVLPPAR